MAHHYAGAAGGYEVAERNKVGAVECRAAVSYRRECLVRVYVGVAVAWKMFGHGLYAAVLKAERVGRRRFGHTLGVFAERALSYYGIGRVRVYIGIGCEVHVHSEQTALACHFLAVFVYELIVGNGSEGHVLGVLRRLFDAHVKPPFTVECYQQRHRGDALRIINHRRILGVGAS